MRAARQLLTVLGLTVLGLAAASCSENVVGPRLVVDEGQYDWGEVEEGDIVSHSFLLENPGSEPLVIDRVVASCACTTMHVDDMIPPGGTGRLDVEVDTLKFSGELAKSVSLYTNDSEKPRRQLFLTGQVQPLIRREPDIAELRGVPGQVVVAEYTIQPWGTDPIELVSIEEQPAEIEASLEEVSRGSEYRLRLEATVPPKRSKAWLILKGRTSAGVERRISAPVQYVILPKIVSVPEDRVVFSRAESSAGSTPEGPGPMKFIDLSSATQETSFQITEVRFKDDGREVFRARCVEVEAGTRYRIEVSIVATAEKKLVRDTLVIHTDVPECSVLEYEVVALF